MENITSGCFQLIKFKKKKKFFRPTTVSYKASSRERSARDLALIISARSSLIPSPTRLESIRGRRSASCSAHNDGLLAICLVLRLRVLHLCQGNLSLESMETTKKITSWHHVDSGERRGGTKGGCFLEFMPCCWGIFSLLTCFVHVSFFLFFLGFFSCGFLLSHAMSYAKKQWC